MLSVLIYIVKQDAICSSGYYVNTEIIHITTPEDTRDITSPATLTICFLCSHDKKQIVACIEKCFLTTTEEQQWQVCHSKMQI